ncbi:hypothetical protein Q4485_14835 [Granulosicoccaceae sp. 1_MG-2023]|nr:hypothetical protein [Granulosicoccaceae sp. 1_MG-2023]
MKDITDLFSAVSKDSSASFEKVSAIQLNFINALMQNQQKLVQDVQADMVDTFSMLKEDSAPEKVRALQQKALANCATRAVEAYKENVAAIGELQKDWTSLSLDNLYAISQFSPKAAEQPPAAAENAATQTPQDATPETTAPEETAAAEEKQTSLAIESESATAAPAAAPAAKKTTARKTVARRSASTRKTTAKKS